MVFQKMLKTSLMMTFVLVTLSTTAYGENANTSTITLEGAGFSGTQLPDYYPASYQQTGIIDHVNSGGGIVISTVGYRLSSNVLVHSPTTEFSSRYDLSAGKEVGFNFTSNENSKTIAEIWILPAGSIMAH